MTQHGRPLGLIVMSDQSLAHDVVCARIFHLEPRGIRHLAVAEARGYGSLDLADIEIGATSLSTKSARRTEGWETGYIRWMTWTHRSRS